MGFFFDNKAGMLPRLLAAAFLSCVLALFCASPVPAEAQQARKTGAVKTAPKKNKAAFRSSGNAVSTYEAKKSPAAVRSGLSAVLIDPAFEKEILNINFFEDATNEVEYMQIYSALADDIDKFKKELKNSVDSANDRYARCLGKAASRHRAELAEINRNISKSGDPQRAQSLKSMLAVLKKEHLDYYGLEAVSVKEKFDGLFKAFLTSFDIQKKVLTSKTPYESATSEISIALDKFEKGVRVKNSVIQKRVGDKFNEIINGADYGDK
ncbi:MAG TPA: hypothetical protein PKW98_01210 [Candidatus Wallbacteria bacterium]|nr:MAG: hypothetical protein BWY32_00772 [bacterium ADurb.Bin243]HOD39770.1 hypothetical protein [Candidatus Wallbacteria bacterium]HPG56408.1 hypothetical protein [Candidatus Wallbacteria bacterium]